MRALLLALTAVLAAAVLTPTSSLAQEPVPPCREFRPCWGPAGPVATLERFEADLEVTDGVLRARYILHLTNDGEMLAEGRIVVPVPPGSSVVDLLLAGGPETLEGRLLNADEAMQIYEEIVRRLVDPALLRSLGDDLFEVRAFPVPAGEERTVSFTVTSPLTAVDDEALIEIPWSRMSPRPLGAVVTADIDVPWEVRTILAPGRRISTERAGEGQIALSWESTSEQALADDFRLYLGGGEGILDTRLLSYRERGEDGYFALLFAPTLDVSERVDRDIIFVIDTSGSMDGDKIDQARRAAAYVLDRLGEDDRFAVIAFSRSVRLFGEGMHPASDADEAGRFIAGLSAAGGTNISGALERAFDLINGERPATVIFLTDGLPTAGIEDPGEILDVARRQAPERTQLFAFGVGYDVDTLLLDGLADEFVGGSYYVTEDEQIDTEVSRLFERISTPILTDVRVDVNGGGVYDLAPAEIRGLFAGSQALLTGRYEDSGGLTVEVRGNTGSGEESFVYELTLPERETSDPAIAQLWAQRRVADLLTELRLEGPRESLVKEIVEVATQFGIVTPYTSYLAEEPEAVLEGTQRSANIVADAAGAPASGEYAVKGAGALEALRDGELSAGGELIRLSGTRSFVFVDGTWIETGDERPEAAPEVVVGSEAFAALMKASPEIADSAALGERVVTRGPEGWVTIVWPEGEAGGSDVVVPDVRPAAATPVPNDGTPSTIVPGGNADPERDGWKPALIAGVVVVVVAVGAVAGAAAVGMKRRRAAV